MARGWESKAIESQIEEAREKKVADAIRNANEVKIDSLLLQRTRVLREIEVSKNAPHLKAGLEYLEESLGALGWMAK